MIMQKRTIIKRIKTIIENYGSFSIADVEGESSPLINSMGKDNVILAERFTKDDVEGVTYVHETVVEYNNFDYEELSKDTLLEILELAELYEVDQEKTIKRISN